MPKDLVLIVEDNPAEQAVLTALAKRAGMDEFLHKPFRVQDFDLLIKRYCISR